MRKILVIGSCGAGKSTLAKELSKKLNLPLIVLDQLYWNKNWERTPRDVWRKKVEELVKGDSWVIDGNHQNTFDLRFPVCDTVILLDINRFVCFWRIWKRRMLKNRVDQLDNCEEKIDFNFMKWVLWDYPGRGRKEIVQFIEKYNEKNIIVINSNKQINNIDSIIA